MLTKDYSHTPPWKKARLASRTPDATLVLYPPSPFGLSCTLKCEPVPGRVVRVLVLPPCCTLPCSNKVVCSYLYFWYLYLLCLPRLSYGSLLVLIIILEAFYLSLILVWNAPFLHGTCTSKWYHLPQIKSYKWYLKFNKGMLFQLVPCFSSCRVWSSLCEIQVHTFG